MNEMRSNYADKLIVRAKSEMNENNNLKAWQLLEDAHIYSQPDPAMHLYVHLEMLKLGVKEKNAWEIFGQLLRILLAVPASVFMRYPDGNTGRSNVGMFKAMPISKRISGKLKELEKMEKLRRANGGAIKQVRRHYPTTRR